MRYLTTDGTSEEARAAKNWEGYFGGKWSDPYTGCLIDTQTNEIVYIDSMDCPEDKFLYRDLGYFVDEMNALAAEVQFEKNLLAVTEAILRESNARVAEVEEENRDLGKDLEDAKFEAAALEYDLSKRAKPGGLG